MSPKVFVAGAVTVVLALAGTTLSAHAEERASSASPGARFPATECYLAKSHRRAAIETRTGQRVELFEGQIAVDGRLENRCTGLPGAHPVAIAPWGEHFAVAFRDEGLHVWTGSKYERVVDVPARHVRALASIGDTLWIGTGQGLWALDKNGAVTDRTPSKLRKSSIVALEPESDGRVLVGTDNQGMWTLHEDRRAEPTQPKAIVGCIRREGGSPRALPPGPACEDEKQAGSLPSAHVTALASQGERLAVGSFDEGLFWLDAAGGVTHVEGVPRHVNALLSVGPRLYVGTAEGLSVWQGAGDSPRKAQRIALGGAFADGREPHVNDLALARDGALWLATNRGLVRWTDGAVRVLSTAQGLPSQLVYAVTETADGAVWAGTARGLARLTTNEARVFSTENGALAHDWVTALWPEGSAVLAGTYNAGVFKIEAGGQSTPVPKTSDAWINPHGITRIGGSLALATEGNGLLSLLNVDPVRLPSSDVTAAVDHRGELWIGTRAGLMRKRSAESPPGKARP